MNITIDATTLLLRSAGVKTYLHYWLASLISESGAYGDTIATYPPSLTVPATIDHESSTATRGAWLRLALIHFCNIRGNPALKLLLARADLFHASQHVARLPRSLRGTKTTATIFDLSCWTASQYHTPANITATRRYADGVLKRCDGLIAISEHTRKDAIDILNIPAERISVIYPGVADSYFDATLPDAARVRAKYLLEKPYLLFVGCIEPRKNIPSLVSAYLQMPEPVRRDVDLIVAGPFGWASEDVRGMLQSSGAGVRYLGYVAEHDLPGLFRGAAALVYPSYYEGFGLPAAQAMAAGIPVIASAGSSLTEVVGDAGYLVDPASVDELREAMLRLITSAEAGPELGRRGKIRASKFRWRDCGRKSFDFFHTVA